MHPECCLNASSLIQIDVTYGNVIFGLSHLKVSSSLGGLGKTDDMLSPATLAQYILATGDEETVASAVEDLLKDGLVSLCAICCHRDSQAEQSACNKVNCLQVLDLT
jgi:hypothetical protein